MLAYFQSVLSLSLGATLSPKFWQVYSGCPPGTPVPEGAILFVSTITTVICSPMVLTSASWCSAGYVLENGQWQGAQPGSEHVIPICHRVVRSHAISIHFCFTCQSQIFHFFWFLHILLSPLHCVIFIHLLQLHTLPCCLRRCADTHYGTPRPSCVVNDECVAEWRRRSAIWEAELMQRLWN